MPTPSRVCLVRRHVQGDDGSLVDAAQAPMLLYPCLIHGWSCDQLTGFWPWGWARHGDGLAPRPHAQERVGWAALHAAAWSKRRNDQGSPAAQPRCPHAPDGLPPGWACPRRRAGAARGDWPPCSRPPRGAWPPRKGRRSERSGTPTLARPSVVAVWSWDWREPAHSRRTVAEGIASRSGSHWASVSCESP
jgi:hypothetical protein